ncbi:aKG-HExxH-type peptide beta-hydroxylase [Roseimaritima sediminicola]|uniref:aKG-HExxH-type peptide beta-hydroxylase n=1 Tax=Roseimaritima sediminicola TaxID=2662066 RepID=UPI0012984D76|nr:HEXXH motif-containing putative peptide modification protein [Roseimaritima sediminicola]
MALASETSTDTANLGELLWADDCVLRLKHNKTVGVLFALDKLLRSIPEPTAEETAFAQSLAECQRASEDVFERVFCDPRAYHWARVAFDAVAAVHRGATVSAGTAEYFGDLGITDPREGLAYHLRQFNLFAAAVALHSETSIQFNPTPLNTPAYLPGTTLSISHGAAPVALCGVHADGTLHLQVAGVPVRRSAHQPTPQENGEPRLHVAPQVACAAGSITLQPHAFNVSGLKDIRSVATASVEDQCRMVETLSTCLQTIQSFAPECFRQMGQYLRVIAFKPPGAGGVFNTSCSRLPGAAIFTATENPWMLADDLIHEFYHNRLFALEERFAFLIDDTPETRPTTFYSPWRDDPRPIYGLFHAAFVFERVHAFWIAAVHSGKLDEMLLAHAKARAAKLGRQLQITLAQLICWGNFSVEGREICERISDSLKRDLATAERLGIGGDTPLVDFTPESGFCYATTEDGQRVYAQDDLIRHLRQYDVHHRTDQIVQEHFEEVRDFAVVMAGLL